MILFEFEGKKLLTEAGIAIPSGQIISSSDETLSTKFPVVLKAQVLSGKRADSGGILFAENDQETRDKLQTLLGSEINKEKVEKVLVEEKVEIEKEYYVSISYDTDSRGPILTISASGGTGIEERGAQKYPINPLDPTKILKQVQDDIKGVDQEVLGKLIGLFFSQDCLLLEVNPLIKLKGNTSKELESPPDSLPLSEENLWMALDAKIKLDDFAKARHKDWDFSPRSAPGHTPTKGEIAAKKIDEGDYRGTAGSSYFDLDGDIAVLSSGGGVSLTALDSLINFGGAPANFTEYSGNPPKEKVAKLTKIVLDKPNIHGLWVIGTVVANFTDIYETLTGFVEGLKQAQEELNTKFDFPIVIRRGGPRVEEAYEMLKQVKDFDFHLQSDETSIAQSAKTMAELAKEYAERSKK